MSAGIRRILSLVQQLSGRIIALGNSKPLPRNASDAELISHADRWAALLEAEEYGGALAHVDRVAHMGWTPDLIRWVIKNYGDAKESQRVTVTGVPTDVQQRKEVTRWPTPRAGAIGELWYDLNIDGQASDLTATFWIVEARDGVRLVLDDIHVM